jgi:histone H3/H4
MASKAKDQGEDLYNRAKRYASETIDNISDSAESAKRKTKDLASDV